MSELSLAPVNISYPATEAGFGVQAAAPANAGHHVMLLIGSGLAGITTSALRVFDHYSDFQSVSDG